MDLEIGRLLPDVDADSMVYVADEELRLVYTNTQWQSFANDNGGTQLAVPPRSTHLLESMGGKQRERWASIYELLLDGQLSHYEEDFICSSPEEHRIYRLRSTPVRDEHGKRFLVHHTVRIDDKAEEREAMRSRLQALDADPEQVEQEYHERVVAPRLEVPGFRVAQFLRPLEGVGGDIVWHRRYDDGTTDLLLADAMGHGYEAGLHAAKMVMMLDSLAARFRAPQDILASLNRGMLRHRAEHETAFASGIIFRFQEGTTCVSSTNFGHGSPIFSRSGEVEMHVGMALGIVDTIPVWKETKLDLAEHGDRFLVFSDGITEQFDALGRMYGTDRLIELLASSQALDLDGLVSRIIEDVTAFRGDAVVKDDQTLIAIESAR